MASIFDAAKAAYGDCISDLMTMGAATEEVMAKQGKKFSTRILLNQFDVLLQYSMLQIALKDGYLANEELSFICSLAKYYALPDFLKTVGYSNATWQVIYNTQEQKLNSIVAEIKNDVAKLSMDFINIFSAFDAVTSYDFFEDLKDNVATIIAAVCQADGKTEEREYRSGCLIIDAMAAIAKRLNK